MEGDRKKKSVESEISELGTEWAKNNVAPFLLFFPGRPGSCGLINGGILSRLAILLP